MFRLVLLSSLFLQQLSAQTVSGVIISTKGDYLPYAHVIGNKAREITITDSNGKFEFAHCLSDTLFVSMVGYADTFAVLKSKNDSSLKIIMSEKRYDLNEFVVNSSSQKYKKELKKIQSPKDKLHYTRYLNIFARIAQKFVSPYGLDGKIEQISFNIKNAESDATVRLRVYTLDGDLPGNNLVSENILLQVKKGSSKIVFDLSEKIIPFPKQGCFVGIDVVKSENRKVKIGFRGYRVQQSGLSLVSDSRIWHPDYIRGTYASFDIDVRVSFYFPKD